MIVKVSTLSNYLKMDGAQITPEIKKLSCLVDKYIFNLSNLVCMTFCIWAYLTGNAIRIKLMSVNCLVTLLYTFG